MSASFIIVTIYLLLVGIILFIIAMVGGKKNGLSADYDQYAGKAVSDHIEEDKKEE